jgi:hypothetical protein
MFSYWDVTKGDAGFAKSVHKYVSFAAVAHLAEGIHLNALLKLQVQFYAHLYNNSEPYVAARWLALLLHIPKFQGSKLWAETVHSIFNVSWFSSLPQIKEKYPKLGHDCILSHNFQFIIYEHSNLKS